MEKSKVEGKVFSTGHISHGLVSLTGENITNVQNLAEVSTVSSERVYPAEETSIRRDCSSEAGKPIKGKRKDLNSFMVCCSKVLKTDSSSSKESGELVQLSSVDSTDAIPCQSVEESFGEKRPLVTHSGESNVVSHEQESSVVTKLDSVASNLGNSQHCKFDLNEGMAAKGAISVIAKVGVPMGSPKKPLQFDGELGWRRSASISAFRPTSFKFSQIENERYNIRGFDLNVAATMDSEHPSEESPTDFVTSKPPERFLLDLNTRSETDDNRHKPSASKFDLNDKPEKFPNNIFHRNENQQLLRRNVAADTCAGTNSGGNTTSPSIFDTRRPPSYWIDLSSMQGIGHVQSQPFLVATTPTAEQVQMIVPSGFYIRKINNLSPNFYPSSNHHVLAPIPQQIQGSVLAAYPSQQLHLIQNQGINPYAYANTRPNFVPNCSIPLMENGNRGVVNPEVLIPVRNCVVQGKRKGG